MSALTKLRTEIEECRNCELCTVGSGPVPFRGRLSRIMVVGEAPGRREDEIGKPFVGPAGKFLWASLRRVGIERQDVFAANAVSCFPGRTPNEAEMYACRGNLYNQVKLCYPEVILALGRVANESLGKKDVPMRELQGTWWDLNWLVEDDVKVFAAYHPAAVLRNKALTRTWRESMREFSSRVVRRSEVTNADSS